MVDAGPRRRVTAALTYSVRMARVLVGAVIVAVVITVFSVVDCAFTERRQIRALPRWVWLLLILVVPLAGAALWLVIGRQRSGGRPIGPDDDPGFLGGPRPVPPRDDADEAFRRFEQDLVDLDIDPDDDADPR